MPSRFNAAFIISTFWKFSCAGYAKYFLTLLLLHSFCLSLSLFIQMHFLYNTLYFCTFLYNFTFIFIFSITHSGFNQKIITHILYIVFITRPHSYGNSGPQISYWSVVGWSVGRWSVLDGRLVGGFKKTPDIYSCVLPYVLMEECISDVVYWFGL